MTFQPRPHFNFNYSRFDNTALTPVKWYKNGSIKKILIYNPMTLHTGMLHNKPMQSCLLLFIKIPSEY